MGNTLKYEDYERVARWLDVEVAAIKAVAEVETGGRGGFLADGRPAILFEGHVFWQRLKLYGISPADCMRGNEEILHLEWTRRYYKGGAREYGRLEQAMRIHERAALESASWGAFQIMGFNYAKCGCSDVNELVERMKAGVAEQLMLWAEFIRHSGLDYCLRHHKWALFAFRYNGKGYKSNNYDKLIEKAYNKHKKENTRK